MTEQYLNSIYFSIITMVTVGYGDIHPISNLEKIFCILQSVVSCCVIGYSFNKIGAILHQISKNNEEYKKSKQAIQKYMLIRKISKAVQVKILKYLEYVYESMRVQQNYNQYITKVLEEIPDSYRE